MVESCVAMGIDNLNNVFVLRKNGGVVVVVVVRNSLGRLVGLEVSLL